MNFLRLCLTATLLHFTLSAGSGILVVLKHCTNSFNKKYIDKVLTPRKPISRTTSLVSTDIYIKPGIVLDSPLYVHVEYFKKFATQYKPFMIKCKTEVCEGLRIKNHPMYPYLHYKGNGTETNILNPCPLKGHIFVKPYYTSYEHMPPLLPTGIWRAVVTVTKGLDENILTITNYYEITATGIEEF